MAYLILLAKCKQICDYTVQVLAMPLSASHTNWLVVNWSLSSNILIPENSFTTAVAFLERDSIAYA